MGGAGGGVGSAPGGRPVRGSAKRGRDLLPQEAGVEDGDPSLGVPVEKMLRKMSVEVEGSASGCAFGGASPSPPAFLDHVGLAPAPLMASAVRGVGNPAASPGLVAGATPGGGGGGSADDDGLDEGMGAGVGSVAGRRPPLGLRVGLYHRHLMVEPEVDKDKSRRLFSSSPDFDDYDYEDSGAVGVGSGRVVAPWATPLPLSDPGLSSAALAEQAAKRYAIIPFPKPLKSLGAGGGGSASGSSGSSGALQGGACSVVRVTEVEDGDDDAENDGRGGSTTPKIVLIDTPQKEERYRDLKVLRARPECVTSDSMDDL